VIDRGAGTVVAVSSNPEHGPLKLNRESITLLKGHGVEGDAHHGELVQHRSRARSDPTLTNLRQVHLICAELHDELRARGFVVAAGAMGENVTTRGLDLLAMPVGTRLRPGAEAVLELSGLRNPCSQLDGIQAGLMKATLERGPAGDLIRRAGVMATVVGGGEVRPGDPIAVELPAGEPIALEPV
jgi:MOSC domain-containing protein YiiM